VQIGSFVNCYYWHDIDVTMAGVYTRCHLRIIEGNTGFEVLSMNVKIVNE
jgi:hypothetical protein